MTEHKSKMPPKGAGRSDIFQTKDPHIALPPLLKHIRKDKKLWCPASGEGRMVEFIKNEGYTVTATDILSGFDFFDLINPQPEFDIIIENPPYKTKDKWLQRCYEIGKPFALMLPITAMGEQKRVKMYKNHGIQILLPEARYEFITPSGKEGGSWFYAAWFTWGLGFERDINFV